MPGLASSGQHCIVV